MANYKATAEDLLIGDLTIGSVDLDVYVQSAWTEIEGKLGFVYVLPIPDTLDAASNALLKSIHTRLATGRFFMAQGGGDEDVNRYGKFLIQEAQRDLEGVVGGIPELRGTGLEKRSPIAPAGERTDPSVVQYDATSPFDTFDKFVNPRRPWTAADVWGGGGAVN